MKLNYVTHTQSGRLASQGFGRILALPPDREAVSARSPESFRGRGMSKSIPPCLCIGTRCEPRRPRGPFLSRGAPRWRRCRDVRQGFTLVELLLVLVILGILAAIVVPKFAGRTEQARVAAAKTQITQFGTALDSFEVDTGHYPKNLSELLVLPSDAQNWHGPYMKIDAIPKDPWQNDYIYKFPGTHNPSSYDLTSAGADGRVNTDDDISNWTIKK